MKKVLKEDSKASGDIFSSEKATPVSTIVVPQKRNDDSDNLVKKKRGRPPKINPIILAEDKTIENESNVESFETKLFNDQSF